MKEGTITARGLSKNGKPTLSIDGQLYYAGKTNLAGLKVGDRLAFEPSSFTTPNGITLWGINENWKLLEAPKSNPLPVPAPSQIASPARPSAPQNALLSITDLERPCTSNWGAELIKAGVIKEPADLGIWVQAILHALRGN